MAVRPVILYPGPCLKADFPAVGNIDASTRAIGIHKDKFCRAYFDGHYPIEIPPTSASPNSPSKCRSTSNNIETCVVA